MPTGGKGGGATSGAVRAGGAFVELFTKDGDLMKGLAKARARMADFGSFMRKSGTAMLGVGAAILAPIAGLMKGAFDKAQSGAFGPKAAGEAFRAALAWERMVNALEKATLPIMSALLPTFEMIAKFAEQNADVVQIIFGIGAGLAVAGVAIVAFGAVLGGLAGIASAAGVAFTVLSAIITGTIVVIKAAIAVVGFILSPVGLLVIAVAALAAGYAYLSYVLGKAALEWAASTEIGKEAIDSFGRMAGAIFGRVSEAAQVVADSFNEAFSGIGANFKTMFGGIVDALKGGNLALAGQIAVTGLQLVWERGVLFMTGIWVKFKASFVDGWHDLLHNIGHLMDELVFQIADGLLDIIGLVDDVEQKKKDLFKERVADQKARNDEFEKGQKEREAFREKQMEGQRGRVAELQKALEGLAGEAAAGAAGGVAAIGAFMPTTAIKGAFQSPDWQAFLSTGDTIPKQQLAMAAKQVVQLENINAALKDAPPMKIK